MSTNGSPLHDYCCAAPKPVSIRSKRMCQGIHFHRISGIIQKHLRIRTLKYSNSFSRDVVHNHQHASLYCWMPTPHEPMAMDGLLREAQGFAYISPSMKAIKNNLTLKNNQSPQFDVIQSISKIIPTKGALIRHFYQGEKTDRAHSTTRFLGLIFDSSIFHINFNASALPLSFTLLPLASDFTLRYSADDLQYLCLQQLCAGVSGNAGDFEETLKMFCCRQV